MESSCRILAAWIIPPPAATNDINLETHQLGRKLRLPIGLPLRISVLGGDVLVLLCSQAHAEPAEFLGTGWTQ